MNEQINELPGSDTEIIPCWSLNPTSSSTMRILRNPGKDWFCLVKQGSNRQELYLYESVPLKCHTELALGKYPLKADNAK